MRKVIALFVLLFCTECYAQSVMGIPFGSSYEEVERLLSQRYGSVNLDKTTNPGQITLYNITFGGLIYDISNFDFVYNGNESYFNYAIFLYSTDNESSVDIYAGKILKNLQAKYEIDVKTQKNEVIYRFGQDPYDDNYYLGRLTVERNDEKLKKYSICLSYGPIHYFNESDDY